MTTRAAAIDDRLEPICPLAATWRTGCSEVSRAAQATIPRDRTSWPKSSARALARRQSSK